MSYYKSETVDRSASGQPADAAAHAADAAAGTARTPRVQSLHCALMRWQHFSA